MKYTFDGYRWNGDDNVPSQYSLDIPERIYLQIVYEDGSEFSETVILNNGDRTFCEDRINQTDVEYVHHKLYAAALARAEAAEAQLADLADRHENAMMKLNQAILDTPLLYQRLQAAEAQLARLRARLEEYDAEWRPHPDATAGEEGEA